MEAHPHPEEPGYLPAITDDELRAMLAAHAAGKPWQRPDLPPLPPVDPGQDAESQQQ